MLIFNKHWNHMCCHKLVDLPPFLKGRSDSRELPNYIFLTSKSCLSKKISNLLISLRFSLTWLLIVRKMNSPLRFYGRSRGSKGYSHSPLRRFAPRCVAYLQYAASSLRRFAPCYVAMDGWNFSLREKHWFILLRKRSFFSAFVMVRFVI